jgi:hypothetical protein
MVYFEYFSKSDDFGVAMVHFFSAWERFERGRSSRSKAILMDDEYVSS